jgi:hypothetical protein
MRIVVKVGGSGLGGVVTDVISDEPATVLVIDNDAEYMDVSETEVDPKEVEKCFKESGE